MVAVCCCCPKHCGFGSPAGHVTRGGAASHPGGIACKSPRMTTRSKSKILRKNCRGIAGGSIHEKWGRRVVHVSNSAECLSTSLMHSASRAGESLNLRTDVDTEGRGGAQALSTRCTAHLALSVTGASGRQWRCQTYSHTCIRTLRDTNTQQFEKDMKHPARQEHVLALRQRPYFLSQSLSAACRLIINQSEISGLLGIK